MNVFVSITISWYKRAATHSTQHWRLSRCHGNCRVLDDKEVGFAKAYHL
jgi:hypothetical protein